MNFALTFVALEPFYNLGYNDDSSSNTYITTKYLNQVSQEYIMHVVDSNGIRMYESLGDGQFKVSEYIVESENMDHSSINYMLMDVNGDGREDFIHVCDDTYFKVWFANGNANFYNISQRYPKHNNYDLSANNYYYLLGDFNGDFKYDFVHVTSNSEMVLWTAKSNGEFDINTKASGYSDLNTKYMQVGRLDNDTKDDILQVYSNNEIRMYISRGTSSFKKYTYNPPSGYSLSSNNYMTIAADFNGDGLLDILHFYNKDGVRVFINNGNYTFTICPSFPNNGYDISANNYKFFYGDFDDDGKHDLLHFINDYSLVIWLSNGDGTFRISEPIRKPDYFFSDNNYMINTGKFTNDYKTDLVHFISSDWLVVWAANFVPQADNFTQSILSNATIDFINYIHDGEDYSSQLKVIIKSFPSSGILVDTIGIPLELDKSYASTSIIYKIYEKTSSLEQDTFEFNVEDSLKTQSKSAYATIKFIKNESPVSNNFTYIGSCKSYFSFSDYVFDEQSPQKNLQIKIISLSDKGTLEMCGIVAEVNETYTCLQGYFSYTSCLKKSMAQFKYSVIDEEPCESEVSTVTLYSSDPNRPKPESQNFSMQINCSSSFSIEPYINDSQQPSSNLRLKITSLPEGATLNVCDKTANVNEIFQCLFIVINVEDCEKDIQTSFNYTVINDDLLESSTSKASLSYTAQKKEDNSENSTIVNISPVSNNFTFIGSCKSYFSFKNYVSDEETSQKDLKIKINSLSSAGILEMCGITAEINETYSCLLGNFTFSSCLKNSMVQFEYLVIDEELYESNVSTVTLYSSDPNRPKPLSQDINMQINCSSSFSIEPYINDSQQLSNYLKLKITSLPEGVTLNVCDKKANEIEIFHCLFIVVNVEDCEKDIQTSFNYVVINDDLLESSTSKVSLSYTVQKKEDNSENSTIVNTSPVSNNFTFIGSCKSYFSFRDSVSDEETSQTNLKIKIISLSSKGTLEMCGIIAETNKAYSCLLGYFAYSSCSKNSMVQFEYLVIDEELYESNVSTVTLYSSDPNRPKPMSQDINIQINCSSSFSIEPYINDSQQNSSYLKLKIVSLPKNVAINICEKDADIDEIYDCLFIVVEVVDCEKELQTSFNYTVINDDLLESSVSQITLLYAVSKKEEYNENSTIVNISPVSNNFTFIGSCKSYFSFNDYVSDEETSQKDLKIKIISLSSAGTLEMCGITAEINETYSCLLGNFTFSSCLKNLMTQFEYLVIDEELHESNVSTVTLYSSDPNRPKPVSQDINLQINCSSSFSIEPYINDSQQLSSYLKLKIKSLPEGVILNICDKIANENEIFHCLFIVINVEDCEKDIQTSFNYTVINDDFLESSTSKVVLSYKIPKKEDNSENSIIVNTSPISNNFTFIGSCKSYFSFENYVSDEETSQKDLKIKIISLSSAGILEMCGIAAETNETYSCLLGNFTFSSCLKNSMTQFEYLVIDEELYESNVSTVTLYSSDPNRPKPLSQDINMQINCSSSFSIEPYINDSQQLSNYLKLKITSLPEGVTLNVCDKKANVNEIFHCLFIVVNVEDCEKDIQTSFNYVVINDDLLESSTSKVMLSYKIPKKEDNSENSTSVNKNPVSNNFTFIGSCRSYFSFTDYVSDEETSQKDLKIKITSLSNAGTLEMCGFTAETNETYSCLLGYFMFSSCLKKSMVQLEYLVIDEELYESNVSTVTLYASDPNRPNPKSNDISMEINCTSSFSIEPYINDSQQFSSYLKLKIVSLPEKAVIHVCEKKANIGEIYDCLFIVVNVDDCENDLETSFSYAVINDDLLESSTSQIILSYTASERENVDKKFNSVFSMRTSLKWVSLGLQEDYYFTCYLNSEIK
ncbi:hypothetical protein SteCoe_34900 [Stentor coeruleus]|uniref:Uncharacterized protein n=1 Tax=Stentor coeruleus TaxID=5963 RepID=A0A1R2ATI9_9CILI|nr:hypothetical protein SteCoe_34900 [Stentor coeruleus]